MLSNQINTSLKAPDVTQYMDYRIYLKDFFEYKKSYFSKSKTPYHSGTFSAACGLKSPQYLKLILSGERNLSKKSISAFSKALQLKKDESLDFELLVLSNQETDPNARALLFKELMDYRVQTKLKQGLINPRAFEQVPDWVTWVLYEMADLTDQSLDEKTIQEKLRKKASLPQIKKAIKKLFDLKLLKIDENFQIKKARHLIENPDQVPPELVRSLQAQFMYLALESLYQDPPTERELASATLSLTQKEFEDIRFKLRHLRKSIQKDTQVARHKERGNRLYQLNIQFFPVTAKESPSLKLKN